MVLRLSFIRSGSSREISTEIIAQVCDNSMYSPAVQEVPYLNRNVTMSLQFCAIEIFYNSFFFFFFFFFFFDAIGPCGGKLQR